MKRILFILPWLEVGGLERAQVTLANALAGIGHEVTIMALQKGETLRSELDPNVRYIYKKPRSLSVMRKIPYIRHKFYDDGMWETRASAKTLYEYYVEKEEYDVEIAFFRGLPAKIISGSTNLDSLKLAWVHSDFKLCAGITNNFRGMLEVKNAYANFDKIVCVSEQARRSFIEVIGLEDKTTTIYNMLPVGEIRKASFAECNRNKNRFTILSVGRMVGVKGYDRLLSVVKRLNEEGAEFDLWLVGDGDDKDSLKQYAVEHQLDNVQFIGQEMNPYCYMRQADLYVCASRYEGYNLAVAESIICETPVLSTECIGPCEILDYGKYGMIVENSEEGLYYGIKEMLENSKLLQEYKEKATQRQQFFDQEQLLEQVDNLFKKTTDL